MTKNPLILLVDDEPQNLQVLGNILRNKGYSFALATNGKDTYKLLEKIIPDLILLDIMLPDIDGFGICEEIKSHAHLNTIPIIFLSAKHNIEDKMRGFELGAVDYITKPFEDIEVTKRVNNHLQAKLDRDKIKKYNLELERMVEQRTQELIIKERESILAHFMQGIIHNVRGPMASIANGMNVIEMMSHDIDTQIQNDEINEKTREELAEIWELNQLNKDKLGSLLDDLNTMLRKSRTDHAEELKSINLNSLIQQEIDFLNVDLEFKNLVDKHIKLSSDELTIEVVSAEITQLFQNLIKNAMDALFNQDDKKITIETGRNKKMAFFKVCDNGPGIPEHFISQIFDPFFTTKPIDNKKQSNVPTGTGIGLNFCKNTAKNYGGSISVMQNQKIGTCFIVELPLAVD